MAGIDIPYKMQSRASSELPSVHQHHHHAMPRRLPRAVNHNITGLYLNDDVSAKPDLDKIYN